MEKWTSPALVPILFVVRLGIPIIVLLVLGALYEQYARRHSAAPAPHAEAVTPCWELMGCEPSAKCIAKERPGVPCWLLMQLRDGHLPERCIDCQVYKEPTTTTFRGV